jgi:hypothetical protein
MALVTTTTTEQVIPVESNTSPAVSGSDAAILLMGALAGATLSKEAKKQYRALRNKLAWQALGLKIKGAFSKKHRHKGDQIAGMDMWLFILLVVAAAAIGVWLFGLWGFIVILLLAAIIYLLLRQAK